MTDKYIQIEEWSQSRFNTIRLRFSKPVPYLVSDSANPRYGVSALNPARYVLKDEYNTQYPVARILSVPDKYDCVDVECGEALSTKGYSVTVSSIEGSPTYEKTIGNLSFHPRLKGGSQTVSLECQQLPPPFVADGKSSVQSSLRKFMSPILDGPNFRALLSAFANGEYWNKENARLAFNQLFVSTASTPYLDRLASSYGVTRSHELAMGDSTFRQYVVRLYSGKLTEKSLYDMLALFYGLDGVCAKLSVTSPSVYGQVQDASTLHLEFDGNTPVTLVFFRNEFSDFMSPSAEEVAVVMSRKLKEQGINAFATVDPMGTLILYSRTKGLRSSVEVLGGTALLWLPLPIEKDSLSANPYASFIGRDADGRLNIFLPAISTAVDRNLSNGTYLSKTEIPPTQEEFSGFMFDEESRCSLTSTETTLAQPISRYSRPGVITVTDASLFGTGSGYLVLNYGFTDVEGPIAYTHVAGNQIYIDPSYRFQFKHLAGATSVVTQLDGNVGYVGQQPASFYLTDSNAAWAVAKSTIEQMLAAGTKYRINIVYPQDSLPLSSIVYMYAPNGN